MPATSPLALPASPALPALPASPASGLRDRVGRPLDVADAAAISLTSSAHAAPDYERIPASEMPFSGNVPIERAEKISTRRPRTSRPPIRVDDVGDVAVGIAAKANLKKTP